MPTLVSIASTFWESFTRQPMGVQKKIQKFLGQFLEFGPSHSSFHYKGMEGDVDPNVREVRVDKIYRAIMLHPPNGQPYCVVYVDHHDDALEWPKGRRFGRDRQGRVLIAHTQVVEWAPGTCPPQPRPPQPGGIFGHVSDDMLAEAGLSRFLIPSVRALRQPEDLEVFAKELQATVAERLHLLFAYDSFEDAKRHLDAGEAVRAALPSSVAEVHVVEDPRDVADAIARVRLLPPAQLHELLTSPVWTGVVRLAAGEPAPEGMPSPPRTRRLDAIMLDRAQQRFAKSVDEGPRLLKGVAGSGKTLLLVSLAMFKAMQGPSRILITCYNLVLTTHISSLLDANLVNPLQRARIEVRSVFQLCGDVLGEDVRHDGEKQAYYDDVVRRALKSLRQAEGPYDSVLVDEAQDLSVDMLKMLAAMAKGKKPDIKLAEDTNQNLFNRRSPSFTWKSVVGVSMRGRTTILRTSHRSTLQICDAADELAGAPLSHTVEDEDGQMIFLQRDDRVGPEVERATFDSPRALADHVVKGVHSLIEQGVPAAEIAVLYPRVLLDGDDKAGIPFECLELIDEGLGSALVCPVKSALEKLEFDLLEDRVKMGSIFAFKGLDFEAVFLLDTLDPKARKGALLFVGATRAREHLHVVTLTAP